jgi:putative aldouronate transport system substrate-binding protein
VDASQFSETNGLKLPLVDKPTKVSLTTRSGVDGLDRKLFLKTLEAVTGLDVELTTLPAGNYTQKMKLLAASKSLPDIFESALDPSDSAVLEQNGALVNFDEYVDELPNFKEIYVENKMNRQLAGGVEGRMYVVQGYNTARDVNHGYMYRKDVFDKHGIPMWENTEEFYNTLKKLKEIYPESTPFVSKRQVGLILDMAKGWGVDLVNHFTFNKQTDKYEYSATMAAFKNMLDFIHKLYTEGLVDPEFLTSTEASWTAKMTRPDKAFVTFDWIDRMDLFYDQIKSEYPDYNLRFAAPVGSAGKYFRLSKVGGANLAVSNNGNAETSVKLVDFLLSPAGAKLATLGVEGESYEMKDGKVHYLHMEGVTPSIVTLEEKYGLFIQSVALRLDPACVYFQYTPKLQEAQDLVNNNGWLMDSAPIPVAVSNGAEKYNSVVSALTTERDVMITNYILSAGDAESIWTAWVDKANKLGVEDAVKLYNDAYNEMR